ncbi:MAG: selenide, water dikinase SelD [Planctomycetota bacterium]|nr:MAG: selenide, water dikinase SelD [Planctomycetota bacterium]
MSTTHNPSQRLTHSVSCAGCAAKVDPRFLQAALGGVTWPRDERVLVGFEHADDAGVFRYPDGSSLVATTDFFTPIVDDPHTFGAVAAANALSDIYAMGAEPLFALSIVHFPEVMGAEVLSGILQGAADIAGEAGCPIIGGHSIRSDQLSFGLAITGRLPADRAAITNTGAQVGDSLILSKALGTGILATAWKKDCCPNHAQATLVATLCRLNRHAGSLLHPFQVHAATDITGFGLVGHGCEMARGSGRRLVIDSRQLPLLPGLAEAIAAGCLTRGDKGNRDYAGDLLEISAGAESTAVHAACDPQSSGGLLISVAPDQAPALLAELHRGGDEQARIIGEVCAGAPGLVLN